MPSQSHISRVVLKNYKSLRDCDVSLDQLTFLVGPNGAGKSNFVEALRFLSYALDNSLQRALDARSGFRTILHKGPTAPSTIVFDISFELADERKGRYRVDLSAAGDGPVAIEREACSVSSGRGKDWFKVQSGVVTSNQGVAPAAAAGRLYLVNASGLAPFESVYRTLSGMVVYNPVPDEIRGFKPETRYSSLDRSGSALAEMVFRLKRSAPERLQRVVEYLGKITPNLVDVDAVSVDANYGLRFVLNGGQQARKEFPSQNISDGTLRALAVLVALFQANDRSPLTLTGLEEPESGLHPAAAGVLFDALTEASRFRQVVVTSHSPDLLDRDDVPESAIQAVEMCDGLTVIGRVDSVGRAALRDRLYTPGELLRMNQLRPEAAPDCADAR
jgi:predicted ATPase